MIYAVVIVIIELLALYSAYRAVMETRTSQGAIAWAVFLLTFPLLSLPAYWIFGRNRFVGYKNARRLKDADVRSKLSHLKQALKPFHAAPDTNGIDVVATGIATFPSLRGNAVELLVDGEATFDSIAEGIKAARESILFEFYIIKDGALAERFGTLLCAKAREGVKVYVLYDEIGSFSLSSSFLKTLRDAGVNVSAFHTTKGPRNRFQINFRNHRKLVVVDEAVCWIGGHNIGDEYLGLDPAFGHWRDTHMKIAGPAAIAAQFSFFEDWHWAYGELPHHFRWQPTPAGDSDTSVLLLPTGPADPFETAELAFVHFINNARTRVWIATPYFVPDDATLDALRLAALRGVDVRILVPEKPDNLLIYFAAYAYFGAVDTLGVRFYRYAQGFMHQKVFVIDEEYATVGTANFDNRSFRLNFEITSIVHERDFTRQTAQMLEHDFAASREMAPGESERKPLWFRFAARVASLASPVL